MTPEHAFVGGPGSLAAELRAAVQGGTPVVRGEVLPMWAEGADLPGQTVAAIPADALRRVLMDRDLATEADAHGLTLSGAIILGELDLNFVSVGYPLTFIRCRFTDLVSARGASLIGLELTSCHLSGTLDLTDSHVGGRLALSSSRLNGRQREGSSLLGENMRVDGEVCADGQFHSVGVIVLRGARIGGRLVMRNATLEGRNPRGDSLSARGVSVGMSALLDERFASAGSIRLSGAHIGGILGMAGAILNGVDRDGASLICERLRCDTGVFLCDSFTSEGAVQMRGAEVSGELNLTSANLKGTDAELGSLAAEGLRCDWAVVMDGEFKAAGTVNLRGSRIGGRLLMHDAVLSGLGDSLVLDGSQISGDVLLDKNFHAVGSVHMVGARLEKLVVSPDPGSLPTLGDVTGWRVQDLYGAVREDRRVAAEWLKSQKAQPWEEVAQLYDRNGQPADARWLRYRSAVHSTDRTSGLTWLTRQCYRWTTGHGYYPLAALVWLAAAFALALLFTVVWAGDFTTPTTPTIRTELTSSEPAAGHGQLNPQPPIQGRAPAGLWTQQWDVPQMNAWSFAQSIVFPAASLTTQPWNPPDWWAPNAAFMALRVCGWLFTAVLLAGLTGLLRKQT